MFSKTSIALLISFIFFSFQIDAQQTILGSITHDDIKRDYILYIPDSYNGDDEVPLIFNFHGLSSTATEQMFYGDFRSIADTAGFILVHPQGTKYQGFTHWNVGGFTTGSSIDDVGFTEALIDSLSAEYMIDEHRIYATGMSNGGYMSFLLACQLSNRIAAIASVTGSMTPQTLDECNAEGIVPVMQIHGTMDPTVPYDGAFFSVSVEDVLEYWRLFNECYETPAIDGVPDSDPNDGCTADHITYDHPFQGSLVEHYKIYGGEHTWPGSGINIGVTNNDFDASETIWNFFNRFNLEGLISNTEDSNRKLAIKSDVIIYPNPAESTLNAYKTSNNRVSYQIFSIYGEILESGEMNGSEKSIDITQFPRGNYVFKTSEQAIRFVRL